MELNVVGPAAGFGLVVEDFGSGGFVGFDVFYYPDDIGVVFLYSHYLLRRTYLT